LPGSGTPTAPSAAVRLGGDDAVKLFLDYKRYLNQNRAPAAHMVPPRIRKLGTLECDMVEATPIVFEGRLYFFEYVRPDYRHKEPTLTGSYFRFWDARRPRPRSTMASSL
jgi:hypothetical protein